MYCDLYSRVELCKRFQTNLTLLKTTEMVKAYKEIGHQAKEQRHTAAQSVAYGGNIPIVFAVVTDMVVVSVRPKMVNVTRFEVSYSKRFTAREKLN